MGKARDAGFRAHVAGFTLAACVLLSGGAWAQAPGRQDEPPPAENPAEIVEAPAETGPPSEPEPPVPTEPPPQARVGDRPSPLDLDRLSTANLDLIYFDPPETYLTPYVARAYENALAFHREMFDWEPWDRSTVLLKDFSDYGNAAARSSPNNAVLFDIAPLNLNFETFSPGERFFTLTNHELAHVATMDVHNGTDRAWRRLFGGKPMPLQDHPESILYNFLATPRVNAPRWYLEGSAVFLETWMAGGFGRAQGAYDEMVFRSKVRDGAHLYSPVGLESEGIVSDFQGGANDYLYGTRFFSYLALTYGPEKVIDWLKRGEGSAGYYSTQFRRVYGRPLDEVWADWRVWEREFQQRNLAAVERRPLTATERLAPGGLGSISRTFYDPQTNGLIGAYRTPGVLPQVGVLDLDTGRIRRLADVKGPMLYRVTSLAYDPTSRQAWYSTDNYAYRDLMQVDVDTGVSRMVQRDSRIGDMAFNPADRSLWGLRHLNGLVTLVRMEPPYEDWSQIRTFDFGVQWFDLDVSPDGTRLSASVGDVAGQQAVEVHDIAALRAGNPDSRVARLELGASTPEGFVFSRDGRSLYGSAYYTGVSNIYRFDIAAQTWAAVSNAATGFFRPMPQEDGSLIVYEYTGDGFAPVRIQPTPLEDLGTVRFLGAEVADRRPVVRTWGAGSPSRVDLEPLITRRDKYVPSRELQWGAGYPVVEGYKGGLTAGYHLIVEDPMQFNQLTATLTYGGDEDLDGERWHADVEYRTLNWRYRYWHNDADFYDLFGPVERSRKGDAILVGYNNTRIYDPPRQLDVFADAAAYFGLDTLPGAQNVGATFEDLVSLEAGARYTDTTRSQGSVDHEKGHRWQVIASTDTANGEAFPRVHGGYDIGRPLPIANSSVWLYSAAGASGGNRMSPLGYFYLGSFGNNYVDDREVKRYRETESFPGFEINEIAARSFVKGVLEWNLPPVRFREVGTASLFLSSVRTALFAGALVTEPALGGGDRSYQTTVGAQFDFNFTVALRLPMTFSIGVAEGFRESGDSSTEVIASLKIL